MINEFFEREHLIPKRHIEKHELKSFKLRQIRYQWRTLMVLEYKTRRNQFDDEFWKIQRNESLSYEERSQHRKEVIDRKSELRKIRSRQPLSCAWCGNRWEDLYYNYHGAMWLCPKCHKSHQEWLEKKRNEVIVSKVGDFWRYKKIFRRAKKTKEEGRLTEELRKTLKAKSDFLGRVNADLYREFIIRTENLLKD